MIKTHLNASSVLGIANIKERKDVVKVGVLFDRAPVLTILNLMLCPGHPGLSQTELSYSMLSPYSCLYLPGFIYLCILTVYSLVPSLY